MTVVVYLDDITVYGDMVNQVLEDTAEAMKRLTLAGFMINLKELSSKVKSQDFGTYVGNGWILDPLHFQA